jgi:DNA-binding transcriptional LysR family regulator
MAPERSVHSIIPGIGLRELRAVLAVAELGSFRRAAQDLGYTQSALSHQVATMERALGRPVFTRPGGRGQVKLTPAGEAVCRRARRAFSEVEAIAFEAEAAEGGQTSRVRVGGSQTTAAEVMPGALRAFREDYPDVEVALWEYDSFEAVASALSRGRVELGFAHNPMPDDRVESIPLLDDSWVILTRRDSSIADIERPSFEVLDGKDVVAWNRKLQVQAELEDAWMRRGIAPRIVYRTDDNLALQRLVAAGLGHACIGRLAARRAIDPSLTWLTPKEFLGPRQIALSYPRNRQMSATTSALMSAIRAQAAQ